MMQNINEAYQTFASGPRSGVGKPYKAKTTPILQGTLKFLPP